MRDNSAAGEIFVNWFVCWQIYLFFIFLMARKAAEGSFSP
jgi:hypothetical protein